MSEVDYTRIHLHLIDDVAKNQIERNRTTDRELWRLFGVGGPQDSTHVPLAGSSPKLGGLEERKTRAVTPPTTPRQVRKARPSDRVDNPPPVLPRASEV